MECLLLNVPDCLPLELDDSGFDHVCSDICRSYDLDEAVERAKTSITETLSPVGPLTAPGIHNTLQDILAEIALETDIDSLIISQSRLAETCAAILASAEAIAEPQVAKMLAMIRTCNRKRQALDAALLAYAVACGGRAEHGMNNWRLSMRNTARRPELKNTSLKNQDLLAMAVFLPHGASLLLERWRRDVDKIVDGFAQLTTGDLSLKRASDHRVYHNRNMVPGSCHYTFVSGKDFGGRRRVFSAIRNGSHQSSVTNQAMELSKRAGGGEVPPNAWSQMRVWAFSYVRFTGEEGGLVALLEASWEEVKL